MFVGRAGCRWLEVAEALDHGEAAFVHEGGLFYEGLRTRPAPLYHRPENIMRPEITRTVEDIQQAIALLRRHL